MRTQNAERLRQALKNSFKGSEQKTEELSNFLNHLSLEELAALQYDWQICARDDQLPPNHIKEGEQAWNIWLLLGGRSGGDSWELNEIPLGEETESYEIDVMDGGSVIRTLQSTTSSVTYSETDQIADWGAAQSSYTVRIYQLSEIYGRGSPGEATITNL